MSRYGRIFQTCYLSRDLDRDLDHWTGTLGVGPFFVMPRRSFSRLVYRGRETDDRDVIDAVALAYSGDMLIELIVPGPSPSTYNDFLDAGHGGVHHLGLACDDYDNQRQAALDAGLTIVMEGASPLARFAYCEADPARPGTILELIETSPAIMAAFDRIRQAAIGWDGHDPVRPL